MATFRTVKEHPGGPPWSRKNYEVLDYATVATRWRNVVRNTETDTSANITLDHYPLIVDVQNRRCWIGQI